MKIKIVLTGPESSGKTTLSQELAEFYNVPYVPEYARAYLEQHGPGYQYHDLIVMAQQQLLLEDAALEETNRFIICDTDLLTYKIWSEYRFGHFDEGLSVALQSAGSKYYLLCSPDIPWEYDPLRENEEDRWTLFDTYHQYLKVNQLKYIIAEGSFAQRKESAIAFIDQICKKK